MNNTIIREAKVSDIDEMVALGLKILAKNPYRGLKVSRVKVYSLATECVSSANNFSWVVVKEGTIVGAVVALVHPIMFYEKRQASVVQFYCTEPGQGMKLLRKLMQWVESRPVIKMVCFTLEMQADPRIGDLLKRLGLEGELPVYLKLMQ